MLVRTINYYSSYNIVVLVLVVLVALVASKYGNTVENIGQNIGKNRKCYGTIVDSRPMVNYGMTIGFFFPFILGTLFF